jgi:hypothetical protein
LQREEYLVKALHDYKSNLRVGGGDGGCHLFLERRGNHRTSRTILRTFSYFAWLN